MKELRDEEEMKKRMFGGEASSGVLGTVLIPPTRDRWKMGHCSGHVSN
jgi:hypothetical protein